MLQEVISRRDMKRRRSPMIEAELIQYHLRWLADELIWVSLDERGLRIGNDLRSCPEAVSKSLLCDRICCMSGRTVGARKKIHTNPVMLDTPSVMRIGRKQLMALQDRMEGGHIRTMRLSGPA
eukprot:8600014-Pyramimonas_sp.AAC.1